MPKFGQQVVRVAIPPPRGRLGHPRPGGREILADRLAVAVECVGDGGNAPAFIAQLSIPVAGTGAAESAWSLSGKRRGSLDGPFPERLSVMGFDAGNLESDLERGWASYFASKKMNVDRPIGK